MTFHETAVFSGTALDRITLTDGAAYYMGDDIFAVDQADETATAPAEEPQRVILSRSDLKAMQASYGPSLRLDDGEAEYMGEGIWIVLQRDATSNAVQNVVLNDADRETLLAA